MQPNTLLAEITAYNPATTSSETIYLSTAGRGAVQLNNIEWCPAILEAPVLTIGIDPPEGSATKDSSTSLGQLEASYGSITIGFTTDWRTDIYVNYEFDGAPITLYIGTAGQPFENYEYYWSGLCGALETSSTSKVGAISLRGNEVALTKPILNQFYDGLGGAGGEDGMAGNPKPWVSGSANNLQPVLINTAYQVYQVHGFGPIGDVRAVYENALTLGLPVTNICNSYDDLIDLNLQPGQWAKAPAVGMFRLPASPVGTITADVLGALDGDTVPMTAGAIVGHIMKAQGGIPVGSIDTGSLASLDTQFPHSFSAVITSDTSVTDFCKDALSQINGYMLAGQDGRWIFGRNVDGGLATTFDTRNMADPRVIDYTRVAQTTTRVWSVTVNADPVWYVNASNEVSDAVKAAQQAAANANTVATQAATMAQAASNALAGFGGVDPYPLLERIDAVSELAERNLTANDRAAQAYRDEAFSRVDELTAAVLQDGENWQDAVNTLTTKFNDQQSAISNEQTVRSGADQANATAITTLGSQVGTNQAAFLDEKKATTDRFSSVASSLSELQAATDSANAGISNEQTARASAIAAETSARTQQISNLNNSLTSSINTEATTRANATGALTTQINQLNASLGNTTSRVTNAEQAIVNGDNANASAIRTVQSNLDGTNNTLAIVQQSANASSNRLGNVEANYALVVQAGNTITGFKAIASSSGTSQLVFDASQFAFRNPGTGGAVQLMTYQNGQLSVTSAAIGNATIQNANIANLAVGTNNIMVNAVTVTHYAALGSILYGNNTFQTAVTYTFNCPQECDLIVIMSSAQSFPSGDKAWESHVYCDGQELAGGGGAKTADTYSLSGEIHVGAGNHTISAKWKGESSSVRLTAMRIITFEARR